MALPATTEGFDNEGPTFRDGSRRVFGSEKQCQKNSQSDHLLRGNLGDGRTATCLIKSFLVGETHKLYDRDRQALMLLEVFDRCMEKNSWELLLVTGTSGTGKTSLVVSTLKRRATSQDGSFVSGKFDFLKRSEQYYPFVRALNTFARIVSQNPARKNEVEECLKGHSDTVALLLDLIPSLAELFDPDTGSKLGRRRSERSLMRQQSLTVEISSSTLGALSRERLTTAFCVFLQAVCSATNPIVLFLDDLQWAEPASLDLFAALAIARIPGLVVVGACRTDELSTCAHLSVVLRELEANNIKIIQVALENLQTVALSRLCTDMFHFEGGRARQWADVVMHYSKGNMFYVGQFLRIAVEEKILQQLADQTWSFASEVEIQGALLGCEDMIQLLSWNLRKQEKDLQDTLMIASCLGAEFTELLLTKTVSVDIQRSLKAAEAKGFLVKSLNCSWRFTHDQIQNTSYSLIPLQEREQFHLHIGRKLLNALSEAELNEHANVVVKQFRLSARLLTNESERERVATLLLEEGELASISAAFLTAQDYIGLGISLLGPRHWRDQYSLSLGLFDAAAEIEYSIGNFSRMDEFIDEIMRNARSSKDKIRAQTAHIYSLGSRNQLQLAIDTGLRTLRNNFGEAFPRKPSVIRIVVELVAMKKSLRRLSDDDVLSISPMADKQRLAAMRIMCIVFVYAIYGRPLVAPLIAFRLVQHSIRYGISGMSSTGFASAAMLLCNAFQDVDMGVRCAELSLLLLEKFDAREWLPRVYSAVYGFCFLFRDPISGQLQPLLRAHRVGLGGGDIEFSMLSASTYAAAALFSCVHLSRLSTEVNSILAVMQSYRQSNMLQFLRPCVQFIHNMRGESADPSELDGDGFVWALAIKEATDTQNLTVITILYLYKMLIASYFRKFDEAEKAAKLLWKLGNDSLTCYCRAVVWLHEGIALLRARSNDPSVRLPRLSRRVRLAKSNFKKLTRLSHYCPPNFASKASVLAAEILVCDGRFHQALLQYDIAIAQAREAKNWGDVGLACELAARTLQGKDRSLEARSYLEQAARAYELWGASAKVVDVRARIL